MAVSKKIRFEVFKRDGFTCQYCGKTPPEVVLEADHIKPKSKKGKDDIDNLITACFDCNRGKSNIPLTELTPSLKQKLTNAQERELQLYEFEKVQRRLRKKVTRDCNKIGKEYSNLYPGYILTDRFKTVSVKIFIEKLGYYNALDCLQLASSKMPNDPDEVLRYFCGICWSKIRGKEIKL